MDLSWEHSGSWTRRLFLVSWAKWESPLNSTCHQWPIQRPQTSACCRDNPVHLTCALCWFLPMGHILRPTLTPLHHSAHESGQSVRPQLLAESWITIFAAVIRIICCLNDFAFRDPFSRVLAQQSGGTRRSFTGSVRQTKWCCQREEKKMHGKQSGSHHLHMLMV